MIEDCCVDCFFCLVLINNIVVDLFFEVLRIELRNVEVCFCEYGVFVGFIGGVVVFGEVGVEVCCLMSVRYEWLIC